MTNEVGSSQKGFLSAVLDSVSGDPASAGSL